MRLSAPGLVVMAIVSLGCERSPAHWKPQRITADRMSLLTIALTDFKELNGRPPLALEELRSCYRFEPEGFVDGWGRPFWYYGASTTYVLASFGEDGRPGVQTSIGSSFYADEDDADLDIVYVNGEWAQFPRLAGNVSEGGQPWVVPKRPICP
jgi:hypothetical protein